MKLSHYSGQVVTLTLQSLSQIRLRFPPRSYSLQVIGYPASKNNYFFDLTMDNKLWGVIQVHCSNKPTLVFCQSRNATVAAANKLVSECAKHSSSYVKSDAQKERLFTAARKIDNDQQLAACVLNGIGYHHAGMTQGNRSLVEQLFATGEDIMVVVATSTLAVGVNLPAYLVVIKGTSHWNASTNSVEECTPLNVRQMIGRAGRPQFGDNSAKAVIMTQQNKVATYEQILSCDAAVTESTLHRHLPDTILSEVVIGTVQTLKDVISYLQHTFFAVRLRHNPSHYTPGPSIIPASTGSPHPNQAPSSLFSATLPAAPPPALNYAAPPAAKPGNKPSADVSHALSSVQWAAQLRVFSMNALALLTKFHCITVDGQHLIPTDFGRTASRCFLTFPSVQAIFDNFPVSTPIALQVSSLPDTDITTLRMLECISASPEFSDIIVRRAEKKELKDISALSRYPVKKGINREQKILILLLAHFTPHRIADPSLKQEAFACQLTAISLCSCLVYYFLARGWLHTAHRALLLLKCLRRGCWAFPSYPQTSQVPILTKDMANALSQAGVNTLAQLQRQEPRALGSLLDRNALFVQSIFSHLQQVPRFTLAVTLTLTSDAKVLTFEAVPAQSSTAHSVGADSFDFRFLLVGQRGKLLHYRSVPTSFSATSSATTFTVELPADVHGTVDIMFVSDFWIGFDIVSRISLDHHFQETRLIAEEDSQDLYAEDGLNVKKRKRPANSDERSATTGQVAGSVPQAKKANPSAEPSDSLASAPCTHKCKNKFTCKHDCCKSHPSIRASGATHLELPTAATSVAQSPRQALYHMTSSIAAPSHSDPRNNIEAVRGPSSPENGASPPHSMPQPPRFARMQPQTTSQGPSFAVPQAQRPVSRAKSPEVLAPLPSAVLTKPTQTVFIEPSLAKPRFSSSNFRSSSKAAGVAAPTSGSKGSNSALSAIANPRLLPALPEKLTCDSLLSSNGASRGPKFAMPTLKPGAKDVSQVQTGRSTPQRTPRPFVVLPENTMPPQAARNIAHPLPMRSAVATSSVLSMTFPANDPKQAPSTAPQPHPSSTASWSALLNWELDPYGPEP